jgi:uncharacterized RDD family membrane protein YckC
MATSFEQRPCNYGKRAIAAIIDYLAMVVPPMIAAVVGIALLFSDALRVIGILLLIAAGLYFAIFPFYNAIQQGRTGQTIGKRQQGIALIREETSQPVGVLFSFLRLIVTWFFNAITGGIFLIVDLIFPAFDKKRQRVVDKMLSTLVVDAVPRSSPLAQNPSSALPFPAPQSGNQRLI